MKNSFFAQLILCFMAALILSSCSAEPEDELEMSSLEEAQQEIAAEVLERIKTPIEKAKKAAELINKQTDDLEKDIKSELEED